MSKVDAQRALREAKYARTKASGPSRREAAAAGRSPANGAAAVPDPQPAGVAKAAPAKAAPAKAGSTETGSGAATPVQGEQCGHKSMNGRTCTRTAGHPEKSHRYS